MAQSEQHFRGDPRYDLEAVRKGFVSHLDAWTGEQQLVSRICAAYRKAEAALESAPDVYRATRWWKVKQETTLAPVIRALQAGDVEALSAMYRRFFRNRCSDGLVEVPYGEAKMMSGRVKGLAGKVFLSDVLYRIDYWRAQTGDRFPVSELAAPMVGDPFGVVLAGTLVTAGSPYQHYCAQRVISELGPGRNVVVEIGGGFGGMAYYLLRDRPELTYVDFDVPVSLALATYFLGRTFPELRFLLYGEQQTTAETIAGADVVLLPVCEMANLPDGGVNVVFSSHAMSDLSREPLERYLETIGRVTRGCFFYMGNSQAAATIAQIVNRSGDRFRLHEAGMSDWHQHTHPMVEETECVYRVG